MIPAEFVVLFIGLTAITVAEIAVVTLIVAVVNMYRRTRRHGSGKMVPYPPPIALIVAVTRATCGGAR